MWTWLVWKTSCGVIKGSSTSDRPNTLTLRTSGFFGSSMSVTGVDFDWILLGKLLEMMLALWPWHWVTSFACLSANQRVEIFIVIASRAWYVTSFWLLVVLTSLVSSISLHQYVSSILAKSTQSFPSGSILTSFAVTLSRLWLASTFRSEVHV